MSPAWARTRTARSGDELTNHEATAQVKSVILSELRVMIFVSHLCFRWYSRGTVYFSVDSLCCPTRAHPDHWQYRVLSGYKSTRRRRESGLRSGMYFQPWMITTLLFFLQLGTVEVTNFRGICFVAEQTLWGPQMSVINVTYHIKNNSVHVLHKTRFIFRAGIICSAIEVK